jgi:subtilisin family serine protease
MSILEGTVPEGVGGPIHKLPTGRGVRVGVVDSGWDRRITDARVIRGVGLVDPEDELSLACSDDDHDRNGHGTLCTDLILQVAPDATIIPIRVFGMRLETSPALLIAAIQWAIDRQIRVVNLSLGTTRTDCIRELYAACEVARRRGVIVVAAAGAIQRHANYPAIFEPVLGATHGPLPDRLGLWYQPGEALECLACGKDQSGRGLRGSLVETSGPSVAAAIVTGHVSRLIELFPDLTLDSLRLRLGELYPTGLGVPESPVHVVRLPNDDAAAT